VGWTAIAAIGKIESDHGRFRVTQTTLTGDPVPPIVGIASTARTVAIGPPCRHHLAQTGAPEPSGAISLEIATYSAEVRRRFVPPEEIGERATLAVVCAVAVGVLAAILGGTAMSAMHLLCTRETGGEAGDVVWSCPDGIAYFLPMTAVAGAAAGAVLVAYTGFEVRRADNAALLALAQFACLLTAAVLALFAIFLLLIGFPPWFAAPYLGVGIAAWLVRRRQGLMLLLESVGIVPLSLVATRILVTAPAVAAAAMAWFAALLLHLVAIRRRRRCVHGRTA